MSAERIKQLHERASECYLGGDYPGALEAWRDVLGLDPRNEQALGGVRLASQFVERDAPVFAEAGPEIEHDLDQGLKVLDALGTTTLFHPEIVDGAIDLEPGPESHDGLDPEEIFDGWDAPAPQASEDGFFGLEPVSPLSPAQAAPQSAAAAELRRRVDELLIEARSKAAAGERDEALAILARLSILDDENAEADALRSQVEADGASDLDRVERAIIDGVAALESDLFDDAERFFRVALQVSPEHREAQHYLERVTERRASGGEELLGDAGGEAAPAPDSVLLAIGIEAEPQIPPPSPKRPRPEATERIDPLDPRSSANRPRFALPKVMVFISLGVLAVALVCAAIAIPHLLDGAAPKTAEPRASGPTPQPARAPGSRPARKAASARTAHVAPANPDERAKGVASGLAEGGSLLSSGDFGGAVVAYAGVLAIDPGNAVAKEGLVDAGERYKAGKAERDALDSIRLAFRDCEFTSALRLAYRLPPSVNGSYANGVKVAGWYNLAVVALRSGDCREARSHLNEALEIAPSDTEAQKLREFALRYADAVKDRVFLARVEALEFRPPPST